MGLLVDGVWREEWYDTNISGGRFERSAAKFRDAISTDGRFCPDADRYPLYVCRARPWAQWALISRELKGLHRIVDVTVVDRLLVTQFTTLVRLTQYISDTLSATAVDPSISRNCVTKCTIY